MWYVCVFAFVNRNTLLCVGEFDAERIFREFFGFNFDLGQGTYVRTQAVWNTRTTININFHSRC